MHAHLLNSDGSCAHYMLCRHESVFILGTNVENSYVASKPLASYTPSDWNVKRSWESSLLLLVAVSAAGGGFLPQ